MKHLQKFENFQNEGEFNKDIETLNKYLKRPITKFQMEPHGLVIVQSEYKMPPAVYFDPEKVDFESLSELNLGTKWYKSDIGININRLRFFNKKLKNLNGFPQIVNGHVDVTSTNIETLEGDLLEVNGKFLASFNDNLKNLKGMPNVTGHYATFNRCANLESLEGLKQCKLLFLLNNDKLQDVSALKGFKGKVIVDQSTFERCDWPEGVDVVDPDELDPDSSKFVADRLENNVV